MLAAASVMLSQRVVDSDIQVSEGLSGFAAVAAGSLAAASVADSPAGCTEVVQAAGMSVVARRSLFCIGSDL